MDLFRFFRRRKPKPTIGPMTLMVFPAATPRHVFHLSAIGEGEYLAIYAGHFTQPIILPKDSHFLSMEFTGSEVKLMMGRR